jgi:cytoskeletal protein CcmA (bactofilin family)
MTTGENAGNWGTKTNVNLQIIEQISGGYTEQDIAGSADTTTLSVSDGSTGAVLGHRVIKFTGTITGNQIVTIPLDVQQMYVLVNGTSGAYTVQFKYASGSGSSVTFAATDKGTKLVYAAADHATNPNLVDSGIASTGDHDLDGNELILDADADTSITADTDDQIDIKIAGADDFTFTANAFNVLTGSHATFADSANAKFGTGNDMLMYHDGSNSYITNAVGALKIATETSGIAVTIGHTTSEVTVADNLTVTGTLTGTLATAAQGNVTSLGTLSTLTVDNIITNGTTIGHTSDTDLLTLTSGVLTVAGELDATTLDISGNADIDGTTNLDAVDIDGAVQLDATFTVGADDQGYDVKFFGDTASAYMLWDTSADDLVLAGAAGIDLAGDIDVDGTANLDAVDIDGAVQIDNTVTVGVNDTGYDVKFFGATSGAYMLWDESTDDLILAGAAKLYLYDAAGGEYLSSSGSALTIASGGTAWELPTSDGSANQLLKTDGSGNLDWTTVSGTITALNNQAANRLTTIGSTTTELDGEANLSFTGSALTCIGTVTVGVDDTGHDVKFFGATSGAYMLWDESTDDLVLAGAAGIDLAGDIDVDGTANLDAVDIDGAVQIDNTVTVGVDDTGYDVKFFGATASAYMLWDASTDDLVLAGAAGIDLAGDIDVDGTANLDAVDIDGAVQLDSTFTVGADDQGYDVKLFGDTASAYMLWDTSADDLILAGAAGLIVPDGQFTLGSTAVGSTAAELNLLDGSAKSTSSITLADSDAIIVIDGTTTKQIPASDLKTYNPGGTSWQAVVTGATTMVSGRGYFVNTTSSAFTMTLPASPSIGDSVTVIDYAGTFDSNNCTVGRNSQKIHGASEDLTVATERAAFTLVFTDSTQGWLLTNN